jgi:hypothetical protein
MIDVASGSLLRSVFMIWMRVMSEIENRLARPPKTQKLNTSTAWRK